MKKSDLTRRAQKFAERTAKGWDSFDPCGQDCVEFGFESGYRAARADLHREIFHKLKHPLCTDTYLARGVLKWLRPIR